MEGQEQLEKNGHPGAGQGSDKPLGGHFTDPARSASPSSDEPERKAPSLVQRLSEAFWEGVALAQPGYERQSTVTEAPSETKDQLSSDHSGMLNWIIQGGKAAATVVVETASIVLDSIGHLTQKIPSLQTKWREAFQAGIASVRPAVGKAPEDPVPPSSDRQAKD